MKKKMIHQFPILFIHTGAELGFFVWGPNFGTNILVWSQDNSLHTCVNAHTQI